jgi:hypothetical protein
LGEVWTAAFSGRAHCGHALPGGASVAAWTRARTWDGLVIMKGSSLRADSGRTGSGPRGAEFGARVSASKGVSAWRLCLGADIATPGATQDAIERKLRGRDLSVRGLAARRPLWPVPGSTGLGVGPLSLWVHSIRAGIQGTREPRTLVSSAQAVVKAGPGCHWPRTGLARESDTVALWGAPRHDAIERSCGARSASAFGSHRPRRVTARHAGWR